jgi:antitoxin component YwqK of YwqJK toxin-antitoxin module
MRFFSFVVMFIVILSVWCCSYHEAYVPLSSQQITTHDDVVMYHGEPFNGVLFDLFPGTSDTAFIGHYKHGLHHGLLRKWYADKQLKEERYFREGKKYGRQISYWENGNMRFEFTARQDAYEGELKEWNREGTLIHLATFHNGQEEGPQKLWYDDGKIRANYVMIRGKRYGLLGTKNCRNVSDSVFNRTTR